MAASVTGLIAFALFLAGGLLLWANGHYKDADGYLTTGSQRFATHEYAITTPSLEVGAGAPGFLLKAEEPQETVATTEEPAFGARRTASAISLFGWFVALRGLTLMAFPTAIENGAGATIDSPGLLLGARVFFLMLSVLGLWFTYVGWRPTQACG